MKKIFLFNLFIILFILQVIYAADIKIINDEIEILKIKVEDDSEEKIDIHIKKWAAKKKLVNIGKEAVESLINVLNDANAQYYAIRALGEIGDQQAVEPLIKILLDPDSESRRYAAMALGRIKDRKAIPALNQVLNDEDDGVRKDARIALEQIQ
ncbi:HEAT repeat domain-containing protein [Candidatus Poribacteria bacterium]|nr:HEAT repeat domain-containing protein [Candidatus Poribacteria bacterium]